VRLHQVRIGERSSQTRERMVGLQEGADPQNSVSWRWARRWTWRLERRRLETARKRARPVLHASTVEARDRPAGTLRQAAGPVHFKCLNTATTKVWRYLVDRWRA
jgi:hypothetical protein